MYWRGWYQLAFEADSATPLQSVPFQGRRLLVVRAEDGTRVFQGSCPHRGADLSKGRVSSRDVLICPFHGYKIALCTPEDKRPAEFQLHEYRSVALGGLIFVSTDDQIPAEFNELESLLRHHVIVPGFSLDVPVNVRFVTENAFDAAHFMSVHLTSGNPSYSVARSDIDEFSVAGHLDVPRSSWRTGDRSSFSSVSVPVVINALSPGIVVTVLGGTDPYVTLTCACPLSETTSRIFFSLAFPPDSQPRVNDRESLRYLLHRSRDGLNKDREIWTGLEVDFPERMTANDSILCKFREWCDQHFSIGSHLP